MAFRTYSTIRPTTGKSFIKVSANVDFSGMNRMIRNLENRQAVLALIMEAMEVPKEYAKEINRETAYRTGALNNSIRLEVVENSRAGGVKVRLTAGNDEVLYAPFIELGTANMDARPFLKPAWMEFADDVKDHIRRGLAALMVGIEVSLARNKGRRTL
jgi:HK97 gp10 family phage protein